MSQFDGRQELGKTIQKAVGNASGDLGRLTETISEDDRTAEQRQRLIAEIVDAHGFEIEWGAGGVESALLARRYRWNSEDMRKGLRHGHVAFLTAAHPGDTPDGFGWDPLDVTATVASAIGLAATLDGMYGTVSLISVPSPQDVVKLIDTGIFEEPDCVFILRADVSGHGFQHTINNTGDHLASITLTIDLKPDAERFVRELQAAVRSIVDEVEEPDALEPTATGFLIQARSDIVANDLVARITALARARAESSGIEIKIDRSNQRAEFQPSRILARRVKTFADTLKVSQDRVKKEPIGAPTFWGGVSRISATAKIRFPVPGTSDSSSPDQSIANAQGIGGATAAAGLDVLGDMEFRGFVEGEMIRGLREKGIVRTPRRWLGVHPVIPRQGPQPKRTSFPDVVVRGPGLPDPAWDEADADDDES